MSVVSNQVRCLVTGEETLRFVNLCRNNGIELRHLVRRENAIQMEIDAENFKKLRPLVRKTPDMMRLLYICCHHQYPYFILFFQRYSICSM